MRTRRTHYDRGPARYLVSIKPDCDMKQISRMIEAYEEWDTPLSKRILWLKSYGLCDPIQACYLITQHRMMTGRPSFGEAIVERIQWTYSLTNA
jgi:hypothetical protein